MPILDFLRVLLGGAETAYDAAILSATEARAKKLLNLNGLRYSDAVKNEIHIISDCGPSTVETERIAYYLGVQMGWRARERLALR
jgi:hypothetical protein